MPMKPEALASAEELIACCETLFVRMGDDIPGCDLIAAVEALLLEAEQAGRCPRILIWRLRMRLAALIHPPKDSTPLRIVAHA